MLRPPGKGLRSRRRIVPLFEAGQSQLKPLGGVSGSYGPDGDPPRPPSPAGRKDVQIGKRASPGNDPIAQSPPASSGPSRAEPKAANAAKNSSNAAFKRASSCRDRLNIQWPAPRRTEHTLPERAHRCRSIAAFGYAENPPPQGTAA